MTFIYVRGDPGASGCGQPGTGRRASHRLQPRPAIKRAGMLPPLGHCPALTAQSARMLTHLAIRDFAVVTAAELEFGTGLTVISGATGAGKSLLVDALGFLSGQRAASGMVRSEEHTSALQSLMRISYAVFCLKTNTNSH